MTDHPSQSNTCPICGSPTGDDRRCDEIFGELMALEFTDPAYGEVHALTVATYMVQHGQYSDEALAWILPKIRALLEDGLTGEQLRKIAASDLGDGPRKWKVTRRPGDRPLPRIAWEITISDVARQADDAGRYRAAVKDWARATLRQQPPL